MLVPDSAPPHPTPPLEQSPTPPPPPHCPGGECLLHTCMEAPRLRHCRRMVFADVVSGTSRSERNFAVTATGTKQMFYTFKHPGLFLRRPQCFYTLEGCQTPAPCVEVAGASQGPPGCPVIGNKDFFGQGHLNKPLCIENTFCRFLLPIGNRWVFA